MAQCSFPSLAWPFPVLKYKYIFQIKYTEAIFIKQHSELLRFEISEMLIAVLRHKIMVLFIVTFDVIHT